MVQLLPIIVQALDQLLVGIDSHGAGKGEDSKTDPTSITKSGRETKGTSASQDTDNVDVGLEVGGLSLRGIGVNVTLEGAAGDRLHIGGTDFLKVLRFDF